MRFTLLLLLSASLLTTPADSLADPSVPHMFFPFGADVGDSILPTGDSSVSPAINVPIGFPFLYGNNSRVFVSVKRHCSVFICITDRLIRVTSIAHVAAATWEAVLVLLVEIAFARD